MKRNIGDRVRIKNFDWFRNEGANMVVAYMTKYYGEVVTIKSVHKGFYRIKEDGGQYCWIDEMFECKMEEETKPKYEDEVNGEYYSTPKYLVKPSGYQFVDENGNIINSKKIILEKKKKEYPKTFEECCKILGFLNVDLCFNADYRSFDTSKEQWRRLGLMNQFYQLLICRDAYWKIAGEEMGLGKPWEPDWHNDEEKYTIEYYDGEIIKDVSLLENRILVFPTKKIRDAFKENFDPDIKICKEFL